MQLHDHPGSAPALAMRGQNGKLLRMQNHAPSHARLKNGEIARKWHKKTGIKGAGLGLVLSRLLAAQCANNTVEAATGNNQQKNRRPRIFINER
ncbi:hypothetical protein [Klebsiella pneumoniae]|uniref:hypothetical protein n=1 Tax=Klebsiella pneumoniae TaxID=573 RepID=UPI0021CBAD74|nr:hypothetical protein [Klebsiella pneumoniae]